MRNKNFRTLLDVLLIVCCTASFYKVSAQQPGVTFPIAELGNCKDQSECHNYCEDKDHKQACFEFAQKNDLMSEQQIDKAEKFLASSEKGPGGCSGLEACDAYCNDSSHINECIAFAEKNNMMSPDELAEAKKVQAAIANGINPPPCGGKKSCDVYCEDPAHMEECINFSSKAGLMSEEEKADSQKMLTALKRGVKPLPCRGKNACDEYCNKSENMESCMNFALEADLIPEQEKADVQKSLEAIKKGVKPPACKGKAGCDAYCQEDSHIDECINFSVAAGMMDAKDAEIAKKTRGKGPGGCVKKEECEAFCKDPLNQETCFNFAKDNGMLPAEDLQRMQQNAQQIQQTLENASPEVIDCLNSAIGSDAVEKLKQGQLFGSKEQGEKMQPCFDKMRQSPRQGMTGQAGPGGCQSPEECQTYCETHPEECGKFNAQKSDSGHKPDEHAGEPTLGPGPGGCQSEAECETYCQAHPQECGAPPPGTIMQQCQGSECDSWHAEGQGGPMPPGSQVEPQQFEQQQSPQQPEVPPSPPQQQEAPVGIINIESLLSSLMVAIQEMIFPR